MASSSGEGIGKVENGKGGEGTDTINLLHEKTENDMRVVL